MENTTFYFEVKESSLEETLFKFAQFFIEPLLKQEAMTRERKAVNSGKSDSFLNLSDTLYCCNTVLNKFLNLG